MTKIMVQLDENNIVIGYGICLNDEHEPIPNGAKIETKINLDAVEIKDNYKLVDSTLVELTENEKPISIPQPSEIELLKEQVSTQQAIIEELLFEVIPSLLPLTEEEMI